MATVSAGTLKAGATDALSPYSAFTVNGSLDLAGDNELLESLSGSGTVTDSASPLTSELSIYNGGATTTFSGVMQNGGTR